MSVKILCLKFHGFVVLPGGLGTLDEILEILTWKQLRLHSKPVVILNVDGYWSALSDLVDSTIDGDFAHPGVKELFTMVDSVEDVFPFLSGLSLLTNCSLQGELFDVGTKDSYIEANCRDNDYWVHPSAIVHETVQLKRSVIMENSEIGENSLIVNSIISPDVKLEPNSIIEDKIVC